MWGYVRKEGGGYHAVEVLAGRRRRLLLERGRRGRRRLGPGLVGVGVACYACGYRVQEFRFRRVWGLGPGGRV